MRNLLKRGCGNGKSFHQNQQKFKWVEIIKEHFIRTKYELGLNKCLNKIDNLIYILFNNKEYKHQYGQTRKKANNKKRFFISEVEEFQLNRQQLCF